MTLRSCKACNGWHDLSEPWPLQCNRIEASRRSHMKGPMIIGDSMPPVQSMLDGQMYDSKAKLRATYRAAGVVEVGNDPSILEPKPFKKPEPDRKAIHASVARAFSQAGLGA